jgi:FKBP-type peptidyl-prolyl cis-trans isomerase FkpA
MTKLSLAVLLSLCVLYFGSSAAQAATSCTSTGLDLEKCLSGEYLKTMSAEKGATVVAGGIVVRPIFTNATGAHPLMTDTVTVGYYLTDREGKLIEETTTGDELATFPLGKLIQCWKTAIPMMSVGSIYKITCPSDTAYGDKGAGTDIKGGAALTFRITLFDIAK